MERTLTNFLRMMLVIDFSEPVRQPEKTRTERDTRLRDEGVGDADLARLHQPIGIQIGARTPEEVAVTIAAQLIESNVIARAKRVTSVAHATVLS